MRLILCFSLRLKDQVLIEINTSAQAAVFDVFVQSMHSGHLLRSIDDWCEADNIVGDLLIEAGIGGTCHDIRAHRQACECLLDPVCEIMCVILLQCMEDRLHLIKCAYFRDADLIFQYCIHIFDMIRQEFCIMRI